MLLFASKQQKHTCPAPELQVLALLFEGPGHGCRSWERRWNYDATLKLQWRCVFPLQSGEWLFSWFLWLFSWFPMKWQRVSVVVAPSSQGNARREGPR